MAGISLKGSGSIHQVSANVRDAILSNGVSCALAGSSSDCINGVEVHTMVFDKYYMRTKSRSSLTVVLMAFQSEIHATCIGAGGGEGAFFRFSWGAEENFVGAAEHALRRLGFT